MHACVLKELNAEIVDDLGIIYLNSQEFSEIPEDWKTINVKPEFKRLESESIKVSLNSVIVKLLETIIKKLKSGHLENYVSQMECISFSEKKFLIHLPTFLEDISNIVMSIHGNLECIKISRRHLISCHVKGLLHKIRMYEVGGFILA